MDVRRAHPGLVVDPVPRPPGERRLEAQGLTAEGPPTEALDGEAVGSEEPAERVASAETVDAPNDPRPEPWRRERWDGPATFVLDAIAARGRRP